MKYIAPESDTGEESLSIGCNAEGSLALFSAFETTNKDSYLKTAVKALDYVNQFLRPGPIAFGYLRDNKMIEIEGISAVFLIMAGLKGYRTLGSKDYLNSAVSWGYYLLTWIRIWRIRNFKVDWAMDPLISSSKPRISNYETSLAARAFLDLFRFTNDRFWLHMTENVFSCINIENEYRGYREELYIALDKKLKSIYFESSHATSAILNFLLQYCRIKNISNIRIF